MTGSVYFISDGGRIKIGFSINPAARLRNLQVGHPQPLEILGAIPGNVALERLLHQRFADRRLVGEWFEASAEMLAAIRAIIADPPPPPMMMGHLPDGGDRELCQRLFAYLRSQHPTRTVENISMLTGVPKQTVAKWIERNSFPSGPIILELLAVYGPTLFAALLTPAPAWVAEARDQERREEIGAEIRRLLVELRGLGFAVPEMTTGPPGDAHPADGDRAPPND